MQRQPLVQNWIFAAAAILLLAVSASVVYSAVRFVQDSKWVLGTLTILRVLDDVATHQEGAIAAQRGYLLTSDVQLRDDFWQGRARLFEDVDALGRNVVDGRVAPLVRALKPIVQQRIQLAVRALSIFETEGLEAAQRYLATNRSRVLDRQIRASLEAIRARELDLLRSRRSALDRSANLMMVLAALGIPISLVMLALVNRALVRENGERRRSEHALAETVRDYRRLSTDMTSLSRFAGMLQSCEDVNELLSITAKAFALFAPSLAGRVYLLRPSRGHAEIAMQWGTHAVDSDQLPSPTDCWAVRRNQPFVCEDISTGICCAHLQVDVAASPAATACFPLSAQGNLMGWLLLSRSGAGPISEYGIALQAAEQLSMATANIRLKEDLWHQSVRDPLTSLYNRRYLEEALAREVSRCTRRGLPLVVMMFDIDDFKQFNDVHGHPGGDALLVAFARLLQSCCRPEDIPCRFGGEEFTLILPEATLETAMERASALLLETSRLVVSQDEVALGRVTTSIGLAALPAHGSTATELIEAADRALYAAKHQGRNRACAADGTCAYAAASTAPSPEARAE